MEVFASSDVTEVGGLLRKLLDIKTCGSKRQSVRVYRRSRVWTWKFQLVDVMEASTSTSSWNFHSLPSTSIYFHSRQGKVPRTSLGVDVLSQRYMAVGGNMEASMGVDGSFREITSI